MAKLEKLRTVFKHTSMFPANDNTTAKGDAHNLDKLFPTFYHVYLIPMFILTLVLAWFARPSTTEVIPEGFKRFQYTYLVVWCVCVGADWLQGPYLYEIYEKYGYSNNEIAILFVTG